MADLKAMALGAAATLTGGEHVHDCTGPDQRCPCGFVLKVGRFCVEIVIHDGGDLIVNDGFNADDIHTVEAALREAIKKVGWRS